LLRDNGERGAHGGFGTKNEGAKRDALPSGSGKLFTLLLRPAAFRPNQHGRPVTGAGPECLGERRRAGALITPQPVRRSVGQRLSHSDGFGDFGYLQTTGLLAGLMGDATPALGPFPAAFKQPPFTPQRCDRYDPGDAQFGGLLYCPLEAVKPDESEKQRDVGDRRARTHFAYDFEPHEVAPGAFHGSQPNAVVIGDLKYLPLLYAKNASEVMGAVAGNFSETAANLFNEESSPCHVQYLRYPSDPKMIALLRGTLIEKHPNQVILDVAGVGYDVTIPVSTFSTLPAAGSQATLRIHTHVREDMFALYGFLTQDEKTLFERLIGVSNIGPGLAIKVLSGMAIEDLINGIRRAEVEKLVRIPGVGRKTAERMVLELRDKLPAPAGDDGTPAPSLSSIEEDVLSALANLGCARPAAEAAVRKARAAGTPAEFEPLFRRTLELVR
jgi:Holliday junction DNA helicase RuvA